MDTVLVLVDRHGDNGGVCRSACALLTLARRLGNPAAVLCGPADPVSIATLRRYGAQTIWSVASSEADTHPIAVRVEALVRLAAEASGVLIAAGHNGQEVAGRVAVRLDSGIVTDAVDLRPGPDGPIAVQEVLAGSHIAESIVVRGTPVWTVRTQAVSAVPEPVEPVIRTVEISLPDGMRATRVVSRILQAPGPHPDVATASVIVAGGHGIGSRDSFDLVRQVAEVLGGAVVGSHTAAELGWCSPNRQVDQVGRIVHPQLYLALGVSGSVRHLAGMQSAKTIVAIDRDPQAPIFKVADFGVVGDLHQVIPELLAEIQRRKRSTEA